jgi:hypothetical protein
MCVRVGSAQTGVVSLKSPDNEAKQSSHQVPKFQPDQWNLPPADDLQHNQVQRHNPPPAIQPLARQAALPTAQELRETWGKPKEFLFGLIQGSTNYRHVLNQLDQVHQSLNEPGNLTLENQIARTREALTTLKGRVLTYIEGSDRQRFKGQMAELLMQITKELGNLEELQESNQKWPDGVTLQEAMDYGRHGIDMKRITVYKEAHIDAATAGQLSAEGMNDPKQIRNHGTVLQFCRDAARWRAELEGQPAIDDAKIAQLTKSAGDAMTAYVLLFEQNDKVPPDLQGLGQTARENTFERLPLRALPPMQRHLAVRLRTLIYENTALVYRKYKDIDQRFLVPGSTPHTPQTATERWGLGTGGTIPADGKTLAQNRTMAVTMIERELAALIPTGRTQVTSDMLSGHFAGLLRDRPDVRLALRTMGTDQRKGLMQTWVENYVKTPQERQTLLVKLSTLLKTYQPVILDSQAQRAMEKMQPASKSALQKKQMQPASKSALQKKPMDRPIVMLDRKPIAEGSYGEVYNAEWKNPDGTERAVIVKRIKQEILGTSAGFASSIIEYLRQSEQYINPYFVPIIDLNPEDPKKLTIVMEKVDGPDLFTLSNRLSPSTKDLSSRPRTKEELCFSRRTEDGRRNLVELGDYVTRQLLAGLETMHNKGFAHLDIKRENLILDKNFQLKVIDLGMCAKKGETFSGGTPATMSPEVAYDHLPQPSSDMYAVGCTLYELVTGHDASRMGRDRTQFDDAQWQHPRLRQCRNFIEACMRNDPDRRPTTQQCLQKIRGLPVTPAPPGTPGLGAKDLYRLDFFAPGPDNDNQVIDLLCQIPEMDFEPPKKIEPPKQ